jgi:hypothetical protein
MDEKAHETKRPNEGMPLSESRVSEEGVPFYYSRERRLAKAPPSVRALYEESAPKKFNLLRPLVSTRSNAILFGTMVCLVLITAVISFSGILVGQDYYGNRISVSAIRYDGAAVIMLKKTRRQAEGAYTGPLEIAVYPPAGSTAPEKRYPYRVVLSSRKTEEFRFSVPFEESDLLLEISSEEGSLAFTFKTK